MGNLVTVITGASGGIGEALARTAAKADRKLVLVARSAKDLQKISESIAASGSKPRPEIFALDLGQVGAADHLAAELRKRDLSVSELVNNAGFGLTGPTESLDPTQQLEIVDLNVRALTDLTLRFLPEIIAAHGGILNVASTAAFQPGPNMSIYCASKAYVLSLSEALYYELKGRVRVTALCPGPTPTGFQKRANPRGRSGLDRLPQTSAEAVAKAGWRGFEKGKRVVIPGILNKIGAFTAALGPRELQLAVLAGLLARRQESN
jgi:short-subunit dehydrogenase